MSNPFFKKRLTAKEYANDLFNKFTGSSESSGSSEMYKNVIKLNATICINEVLDTVNFINSTNEEIKLRMYYMDVRAEINKL